MLKVDDTEETLLLISEYQLHELIFLMALQHCRSSRTSAWDLLISFVGMRGQSCRSQAGVKA